MKGETRSRIYCLSSFVIYRQRLQCAASLGQFIMKESTYKNMKEVFKWNKVVKVNLKKKSRPMNFYEMVDEMKGKILNPTSDEWMNRVQDVLFQSQCGKLFYL